MDYQVLKEDIISFAHEIGIDKIGFTHAGSFDHMEDSLYDQKAKGYTTGFEHGNISERIHPHLIFDQPQSIISIALAYPSVMTNPLPKERDNKRGMFARASWGEDYHHILRDKLALLQDYLTDRLDDVRCKPMVDTGELMDVLVAQRAGLGFIGRNGLLITEEFGSWVYLGEMITNLPLPPDQPGEFACGDCYRCIEACPPSALLGNGQMNARRCLSYQTQTKQLMPKEFRRKISTVIYGCDICQYVCPYNQGIDVHHHPRMEPNPHAVQPSLKHLVTISNREFKETFGSMAGSWRGKKPLQRNAIIAMANSRDVTSMPLLIEIMETDNREVIRATAAWAIAQLQKYHNPVLIEAMVLQAQKETDVDIIQEFQEAIDQLSSKRHPPHKQA